MSIGSTNVPTADTSPATTTDASAQSRRVPLLVTAGHDRCHDTEQADLLTATRPVVPMSGSLTAGTATLLGMPGQRSSAISSSDIVWPCLIISCRQGSDFGAPVRLLA